MADELTRRDGPAAGQEWPDVVRKIRARTPARLLAGRAGAAYRTSTQLDLREAHAAARDAVRDELDLRAAFGVEFVKHWSLAEFLTRARGKDEYLLRPDLGRRFDDESRVRLQESCPRERDIQIAIGDGLSVSAVAEQVPRLLPLLFDGARARGWSAGRTVVIRRCRVGILNEIGELLAPQVAVLLIGERPGLATATSLSAYMAFRPKKTDSDANRNLISNIHARGVGAEEAAERILGLAAQMMKAGSSGCELREDSGGLEDRPMAAKVLEGQVALVTGAAKRIGRSIALRLANDGADVAVNYATSKAEAEAVASEIRAMGRRAIAVQADVSRRAEVERLFAATEKEFGRLDILINNAGMFFSAKFEELTDEQWDRIMNANLKSQFLCAQAAAPIMKRQGRGRIINLSSLGGMLPWPAYTHYCTSKAGSIMLTRCLARALGPEILVNSVAPGTIQFPGEAPDEDYVRRVPLHRTGTGGDIAGAVAYLATADFVTGQVIAVDGGRSLV